MALTLEDVYKFIDDFDNSGMQIASVAAATGTGKSTTFPRGFYLSGKTLFVVQPTVTASTSAAKYMSRFIPESDIGTAVERTIRYKNSDLNNREEGKTPLVYCTAGHLRNILLRFAEKERSSAFVDYIFLDEAHSGDLQYDGIMYLYEYLRKKDLPLPRLMLITATPGVYPFTEDLIFKAVYPGDNKPVEVIYHNRDYPNLKGKDYKDLFYDVAEVVIREHKLDPVPDDCWDAWLVFCPGKAEIREVVAHLQETTKGTIIIPLYSGMTDETEIQYDIIPPNGIRKIVVSTNVAEASITVDGLSFVFDTLVEKITTQSKNGMTMLVNTNISKISAKQRKGRSGRTRDGRCYRMCTEQYFETKLEDIRKREIERIAPDGLILDLFSRKLDVEDIVIDNAISVKTLRESKMRLATIGLLNETQTGVTLAGEWIKSTPLSPRSGMFYWLWSIYSEFNFYIGAIFTAIIETHGGGYFYIGDEDPPIHTILKKKFPGVITQLNNASKKTPFFFNICLILNIIKYFETIDISPRDLKIFCAENNLNNAKIKECFKVIKYLCTKSTRRFPIQIGLFDIEEELEKAEGFLYQCFSDQVYVYGSSKRHKIRSEIDSFMTPRDAIRPREYVIPLSSNETESRTYVSMYHLIDTPPDFKISLERI